MFRRISTPRAGRGSSMRDPRLWLGVALIAGSAFAGNAVVRGIAHREPAVVMVHDVASGTRLQANDVREVSVSVPAGTDLVASSEAISGTVAARPLTAGELVPASAVGEQAPATVRVVSLPIKAGHLPQLAHGAVVEIWLTPSVQGMELPGPARLVVERAVVVEAPEIADATSDAAVTLQVDAMDVSALATALRDGTVDVALIPGGRA